MFEVYFDANEEEVKSIQKKTEEEFNKEYIKFNSEFKQFFVYNIGQYNQNSINDNQINEKEKTKAVSNNKLKTSINKNIPCQEDEELYTVFTTKVLSIMELNMNQNQTHKAYPLIYKTIASILITDNETQTNHYLYNTFFIIFTLNDILQYDDIDKIDYYAKSLSSLFTLIIPYCNKTIIQQSYSILCSKFLIVFFDKVKYLYESKYSNVDYSLISFLLFYIPYHDKILSKILKAFFNEETLSIVTKQSMLLNSLTTLFSSLYYSQSPSINKNDLNTLITRNESITILKAMSLVGNDKTLLSLYISSLLAGIKDFLIPLKKKMKPIELFLQIDKVKNTYFNKTIRNFFELKEITSDYKKMIFDVLNNDGKINEFFVAAFDQLLRCRSPQEHIDLILSYFQIIEQFEVFEWVYVHKVINRAVDEVFDLIKEKELIDKIEAVKGINTGYTYKLQTLINYIKISRTAKANLIVLPFHSYHLYNIGFDPIISPSLSQIFAEQIKISKFPENSRLIYQQGNILFTTKMIKKVIFKGDVIEYEMLNYINVKGKDLKSIKKALGLNEEFCLFTLKILVKIGIIQYDKVKDLYTINFSFDKDDINEGKEKNVDLCFDYANYLNSLDSNVKFTAKYLSSIHDCYIIKYLKKIMNTGLYSPLEDIFNHVITEVSSSLTQGLTKEMVQERLADLSLKGFIAQFKETQYKYIAN